jgi:hypothetical protein
MKLCYVTCFLDIQRDRWTHFQRTVDQYFDEFLPLLNMFLEHPDAPAHDLVVFLDRTYLDRMPASLPAHIHVQPIDEAYMQAHCPLWQRMDKEKAIMESAPYQDLVRHRLHHPEHNNPRYTLINHCKVDIVHEAMGLVPDATHFAWVDFGYCKHPGTLPRQFLDLGKVAADRVNYTLINPIDPTTDGNVVRTLQYAPEKVGGFFFCGSKDALTEYRDLYHLTHRHLQDNNIVDDDQHIALLCYLQRPGLFCMHHLGGFHRALTAFQK